MTSPDIRSIGRRAALAGFWFLGLLMVLVNPALAASSNASPEFKVGTDFDDKIEAAGNVGLNICRLFFLGVIIVTFIRFCFTKKWIDIGFTLLGVLGFAMSKKIVTAILTWGGNGGS